LSVLRRHEQCISVILFAGCAFLIRLDVYVKEKTVCVDKFIEEKKLLSYKPFEKEQFFRRHPITQNQR